MKKIFLFTIISLLSISCGKKVSKEKQAVSKEDTSSKVLVGADTGVHNCKASAGYTWSTLRKECIRVFEEGTPLAHYDDGKKYSTVAYVVFDQESNKAELFLDTQKESIILERKSEGDSWINQDWQLIPWKGFVLKKGNTILYTGK